MILLLKLVWGFLLFEVTWAVDPCTQARLIDEPTRSAGYRVPNPDYDSLICDRLLQPGWYKFSGGNTIPETCPDIYHCGTHVPIWVYGSHPSVADGIVTIETCGHTSSGCCGYRDNIRVKNCGTFYVYELQPTRGCSAAYCAGSGAPCPPDQWSPTGFMPGCISAYPKMTQSPHLSNPIIKPDTFVFNCHIPYDPSKTDAGFQVTWLFDGKSDPKVPVTQVTGSGRDAELDQKYLEGHLGTEVSCAVSTYLLTSPGRKGPPVPSNPYWAGIKLSESRLTVGENEKQRTVQIISTIPIVCNKTAQPSCQLEIYLEPNNKDIRQTTSCTQTLRPGDWNPRTNQAVTSFQVLAERDYKKDGDKNLVMHFSPIFSVDAAPVFNNYTLPFMQIQTKDKDTALCSCTGDPHCTTLDQQLDRRHRYSYYKVGEFTMYKSTSRPFEVQARTWHCGHVSCNCAVAAREGNDVITIDMCHGRYGHSFPKVRVQHQGQLSQGTVVHTNDARTEFLISFPSGAWVKAVCKNGRVMDIYIHAPEEDYGSTQGLCGTFNRRTTDDLTGPHGHVHPWSSHPNRFVESWRIPIGTSMFDKVVPIDPKLNTHLTYCNCDQQKKLVDCRVENKAYTPPTHTICAGCHSTLIQGGNNGRSCNKRRSLDSAVESGVAGYSYDYGFLFTPTLGSFPTKNGFTQASAEKACNDSFNANPVIQQCIKQIGIDVGPALETCVDDIKQMDNLDFVESAVDSIVMNCIELAIKNPQFFDNSTGRPPSFITDSCPVKCYGKGVCIHGNCRCNAGFTGDACEINTTQPPSLVAVDTTDHYVRTADTCDVTVKSCKSITVIGDNIAPSPKLHCRLVELKFDGSKFNPTGQTVTVGADYISLNSVACMVPVQPANHGRVGMSYNISVTNNGVDFSNTEQAFIIDSTCLTCSANGGNCSIKADTCLIDGVCRTKGAVSPTSSNHACDPVKNNKDWTVSDPSITATPTTAAPVVSTASSRPSSPVTPTIPYPVAPIGGTVLSRFDVWTTTQTGCPCNHNNVSVTCACCDDGGCQCPGSNAHQCTQCGDQPACGSPQTAPDFGVDGYTLALNDCECKFDTARSNCACCQDNVNACQCPKEHRNQCVDCQHMDRCGSKPWIFGPAMPST